MKKYLAYINCFMCGMIVAMMGVYALQYRGSIKASPVTTFHIDNQTWTSSEIFRTGDTVLIGKDTAYVGHAYEDHINYHFPKVKHILK